MTTKQDRAMSASPALVTRYGPEWWALYAAAWQTRWPPVRSGIGVQEKNGVFSRSPVDPSAVAIMAAQDADEGIAAFNDMICKLGAP